MYSFFVEAWNEKGHEDNDSLCSRSIFDSDKRNGEVIRCIYAIVTKGFGYILFVDRNKSCNINTIITDHGTESIPWTSDLVPYQTSNDTNRGIFVDIGIPFDVDGEKELHTKIIKESKMEFKNNSNTKEYFAIIDQVTKCLWNSDKENEIIWLNTEASNSIKKELGTVEYFIIVSIYIDIAFVINKFENDVKDNNTNEK